ncbi:unnamed protein product [Heligmosomoides polygyrus]|uniref:Uncharacterized protein n=1 Tax=Heligmosomoides polygyrus TaxID=6339 RepID=A0A3P8AQJ6_HELPZ|nr:unnamed protein product [Heligmosomoides polygyrus]
MTDLEDIADVMCGQTAPHVLDYEQRFVLVKALEAIEHVMVKVNENLMVTNDRETRNRGQRRDAEQEYGLLKGRSVKTVLLTSLNDRSKDIEEKECTDVVYFDFSKAFDKVPLEKLLIKMGAVGIHPMIMDWTRQFLSGRTYQVKIKCEFSKYNGTITHKIKCIPHSKIPNQKPYHVPLEKRNEIARQIKEMLKTRLIEPSTNKTNGWKTAENSRRPAVTSYAATTAQDANPMEKRAAKQAGGGQQTSRTKNGPLQNFLKGQLCGVVALAVPCLQMHPITFLAIIAITVAIAMAYPQQADPRAVNLGRTVEVTQAEEVVPTMEPFPTGEDKPIMMEETRRHQARETAQAEVLLGQIDRPTMEETAPTVELFPVGEAQRMGMEETRKRRARETALSTVLLVPTDRPTTGGADPVETEEAVQLNYAEWTWKLGSVFLSIWSFGRVIENLSPVPPLYASLKRGTHRRWPEEDTGSVFLSIWSFGRVIENLSPVPPLYASLKRGTHRRWPEEDT